MKPVGRAVLIDTMFGQSLGSDSHYAGRTRIIFRDSFPSWRLFETGDPLQPLTEVKAENTINLEDSEAMPRFIERVLPFTRFDMECVLSVYEKDDEEGMKSLLSEGFRLLEDSYLGGNGTRGYGKVKFEKIEYADRDVKYYEGKSTG